MNEIYSADPANAAAIPYASVYTTPTTGAPTYSSESPLYMQQNITAPYQTIYPVRALTCGLYYKTFYGRNLRIFIMG